jgi:hypothetical protein
MDLQGGCSSPGAFSGEDQVHFVTDMFENHDLCQITTESMQRTKLSSYLVPVPLQLCSLTSNSYNRSSSGICVKFRNRQRKVLRSGNFVSETKFKTRQKDKSLEPRRRSHQNFFTQELKLLGTSGSHL